MSPAWVDAGGWSAWPAPAKLNLFLQITGRRADGYHELQTVFRLLDWGDTIRLKVLDGPDIRRESFDVAGRVMPPAGGIAEADDLTVRAAKLLQESANCRKGAVIGIEKRIPMGGGFGGGSSDAATVLVALDRLWGTRLGADVLAELALRLGADVPVFVHGHNAWAEGVGERLVPIALPPAWYLLVAPGVYAPTGPLFRDPDLTRNAVPARIADFVSGAVSGNAFEPVLRRREPAVDAAFAALARVGTPRLTGSGSGCFVQFPDRASAEAALAALPESLPARVAAGAARSPLLDVLAERRKF